MFRQVLLMSVGDGYHIKTMMSGHGPSHGTTTDDHSLTLSPMTTTMSGDSTPSLTPSPSLSPSPTIPAQPDHFYSQDGDGHPAPFSPGHAWLSPDNDPLATKGIPVFKPTMDEFRDFEAYMTRVEFWGMRSGIVKIIPPKEWSDALPSILPQLADVRIKSPIEQHMLGRAGIFRQQNIERRKAVSVREWAELCAKDDYRAPAVDEVGLKSAGAHAPYVKRKNKKRETTIVKEEEMSTKDEFEDEAGTDDTVSVHELPTPAPGADSDSENDADATAEAETDGHSTSRPPGRRKRQYPTRAEREATLAMRAELDKEFLQTFDPKMGWLPRNTSASDYTPSFCSTLERRYWRNCGLGKPPWYGADSAGSLFTDETTCWNVGCLPSTLSRILPKSSAGLPGVNTPYLYFGMWRATFAWHVEDMDLFSINYIHFGAPKFWYSVPQGRAMQLENTLRSFFPRDGAKCRQFLRHKSFLASPTLLAQSGCKPNMLVQHAGEFVVTYPRGYHAGFNLGFNCAESVNFALESWLDIGRKAQACGCVGDSVRINVDELLRAQEEEAALEASKPAPKPRRKKRKSEGDAQPRAKKQKISDGSAEDIPSSSSIAPKHKILLKVPKELGPFPCCLCVSRDTDGLLRVHDLPSSWSGCQNFMPKDASGQEIWRAHEKCAMAIPETWVDDDTDDTGQTERVVFGIDVIVKDRWSLKCSLCQKSRARLHGAPIQCTKGKCPKAFHISCARDGGGENRVHFAELREIEKEVISNDIVPPVEQLSELMDIPKPTLHVDGTDAEPPIFPTLSSNVVVDSQTLGATPQPNVIKTIKKIEYELLCTQHNPVVVAARRANKQDRVRNELLALPVMSRIKLRVSAGVFEVSLLSVNEERNTIEVIWDDGIRREFKWSSLVWGKTDQMVGHKPTVAAPEQPNFPKLNVRFTPSYATASSLSSYTGQPPPTHPANFAGPSNPSQTPPYSTFTTTHSGDGRFGYSERPNSYMAFPSGGGQASSVSPGQSTYPYYGYSTGFQSGAASMAWHPQFSSAFHETVASTVASLPARSGLGNVSGPSAGRDPMATSVSPVPAMNSLINAEHPVSVKTVTASESGNGQPPEVIAAVEEIQKLSSLEPDRLQAVLSSRPALLEAVKMLVAQQAEAAA
ncbi:JmjC-domain-containing protein [Fomitiporia mediterranea MF3/22]|uniref:JmjC-domain-containing protein n=1 Tax=Fomitiporia mediterranea (strain MF3/22) TaxID=694068 RepID=UPI00044096F6|nr:JmjC-domain-containing protein [Fomitiporia mediterranea MF3/22]EJD00680.1 JmjC-domain-containing protein [Fomitiporia mediterranea MF3/22]